MVRKIILCLCLSVILAVPITASANEIYEGNISSSYTTIFKDIAEKEVGFNEDYIFYRSGQYEFSLVVGDIAINDGVIASNGEVRIYAISTNSNYNSIYEYSVSSSSSFSMSISNELIYSNLGNYPDLIERSNYYEIATFILLLTCLCCYLFRNIFRSSFGSRYS